MCLQKQRMAAIAEDREWGVKSIKQSEVERRVRQHRISGGMDGDWMNTWEPQEVLTNAQVAINECLRDRSACNSAPKQCHTGHDGA